MHTLPDAFVGYIHWGEEGGQLLRKMDKEKDEEWGGEREGNRNGMRKRERERRMLVNVAGVEVDLRSSGTL